MQEIVQKCTHGIDIHTGSNFRSNLPHVRTDLEDEVSLDLARTFGTPMIIHSGIRDGSLREAVSEQGTPVLLYEGGEALYFNDAAIKTGVKGIHNVMRAIGMLPKSRKAVPNEPVETCDKYCFPCSWISWQASPPPD